MLSLYIMRHGEAEHHAETDQARQLTAFGKKQAIVAAGHLAADSSSDYRMVVSPYIRAQQTAKEVAKQLVVQPPIVLMESITPDVNPMNAVKEIDQFLEKNETERLIVVSHLPMVSRLINLLVWGENGQQVAMGTAYLAKIRFDVFGIGLGELCWVKPPEMVA